MILFSKLNRLQYDGWHQQEEADERNMEFRCDL